MARPKAKAPVRRYHLSGQSVVTIAGRDFYLGPHDSPLSIARYAVLIATYQAGGLSLTDDFELSSLDERVAMLLGHESAAVSQQPVAPVLVQHVTALFREHIKTKYANTLQEKNRHDRLCDQLDEHHANLPAEQFGPVRLKEFRDRLVRQGLARRYVNRLVNCVIAIFRHSVAGELIDVSVIERLKTLEPLRAGQTEAPETDEVEPAKLEHVRKTAEHLSPIIKAMLRSQIATGMRPKEICMLRPVDIDRDGEVWLYRPATHKTAHKGKRRAIPLVGDARGRDHGIPAAPAGCLLFLPGRGDGLAACCRGQQKGDAGQLREPPRH